MRVCSTCYDRPQEQLRAIILPPDPPPVYQPRIEPYDVDELNAYTLSAILGKPGMFADISSVSCELDNSLGIPSAFEGVSDVTSSMVLGLPLVAAVDGVSAVTATQVLGASLVADVDGVSAVTATLTQVVAVVDRELTDTFTINYGASPYTESGASLGSAASNRLIFVAISLDKDADAGLVSVTVGGVSATLGVAVRRAVTTYFITSEIWWAAVPTGTTGDIVITGTGGDTFFGGVAVYKVTGADTITPIDNSDTGSVASGNVTTDVTIGANTATISTAYVGINTTDPTVTFTNITEDFEFGVNSGVFVSGGAASREDAASVGAITLTASVSSDNIDTNKVMAAVVIAA